MKNILLIVSVASLAMTSCQKDYTCECTQTTAVGPYVEESTIHDTKGSAKKQCDVLTATGRDGYSCVIK